MAGTANAKDVKALSRSPHHMLKRAAQFAAQLYAESVGRSGLTLRQFTLLSMVDVNDGVSQTLLVKLTGIDRSTLAELVDRLVLQGYVQRKRTKDDARTNSVRITPAGKKMLKGAQPAADEVDKRLIGEIPAAHRRAFLEVLSLLSERMDAIEKDEARDPARGRIRKRA